MDQQGIVDVLLDQLSSHALAVRVEAARALRAWQTAFDGPHIDRLRSLENLEASRLLRRLEIGASAP